jgi:ankyrin repeat protein
MSKFTLLISAIRQSDSRKVRALLMQGADPNLKTPAGFRALHLALEQRNREISRILLDYGADVNAMDTEGKFLWKVQSWLAILLRLNCF